MKYSTHYRREASLIQACVGFLLSGPVCILTLAVVANRPFGLVSAIEIELWMIAFGAAFGWILPGTAELWRPLFVKLPWIGKKQ